MTRTKPQQEPHRFYRWLPVILAAVLTGCSTLGYYYQSAKGQLDLMCRARDIDEVLADEGVPDAVKNRLHRVKEMRRYASAALRLPDNDSYREYADLEREFAIWNVFAAPELSVEPHHWCFPIVGCVVYRGYFDEADAHDYAQNLADRSGLETFVAGVPAYSTIGWFDDPVVSTILGYPEAQLAGLIFHELAHQVAYARGDSVFNESFATAVEIEGVERWLQDQGRTREIEAYRQLRERDARVVETILEYRRRLDAAYRSDRDRDWKLARKAEIIAALRRRYAELVADWDGYRGYDRWFSQDLNNAHFVIIAAYHDRVDEFQTLLARHGGDLPAFYDTVKELARRPEAERNGFLDDLESGNPTGSSASSTQAEDAT